MAETPAETVPPPRGSGVAFVTGAGGFIGRHVASAFLRTGWRVVGFSHHLPPDDPALDLHLPQHWSVGSLAHDRLVQAASQVGRPEIVIHAAGGSTVGASLADPKDDFARNVESLSEVLAFLRGDAPTARLVFLSSAAVYGATTHAEIGEGETVAPISPYGEHKRRAEEMVGNAADTWDLDAAIVRFFSVYGPGNRKQLFWEVANRLCTGLRRLEFSGSGDETRDFLYIDDAVRLIGLLSGPDSDNLPEVVNGGTGIATSVRQAVEELRGALRIDAEIAFTGEERRGDPERLVASPALARGLGFAPQTSFSEGIDRYARWVSATLR